MALNILLVEDNESTKKMIELTFDNEDVTVSTLDDTIDALKKIKEMSPDIIILDEDLRGMKGTDLCREIKKDYMFMTTPVILLSSWTGEEPKENTAEGVITKPFKSIEIINMVSKLTGKSFKSLGDSDSDSMGSDEGEDSRETGELDLSRLERGDAILKLDVSDELNEENDITEVTRSVEIFPEEILDEDEKGIDFSNILDDEDDDFDINSKSFAGRDRNRFSSNQKDMNDDNIKRLEEELFNNAKGGMSDSTLNKAVLSKFLGERLEPAVQKVANEITKDLLKEVIEKSLREVMEKSFKNISQQILKQIEQVSWEVVPDLAEVLIRKEIEKLKEGTETLNHE